MSKGSFSMIWNEKETRWTLCYYKNKLKHFSIESREKFIQYVNIPQLPKHPISKHQSFLDTTRCVVCFRIVSISANRFSLVELGSLVLYSKELVVFVVISRVVIVLLMLCRSDWLKARWLFLWRNFLALLSLKVKCSTVQSM